MARLGFIDDYIKLSRANFRGLSGRGSSSGRRCWARGQRLDRWLTRARGTGLALPVFKEILIPSACFFPCSAAGDVGAATR